MLKINRQQKILELIKRHEIETQEELCLILNNCGYNATQATISRDIKELKLIKIDGKKKKFRYAQVSGSGQLDDGKFISLFRNAVVSIEAAGNIIVIKTLVSNGGPVGATIDALGYPEILGCVAGDDTLLVVTHSETEAGNVAKRLHELL